MSLSALGCRNTHLDKCSRQNLALKSVPSYCKQRNNQIEPTDRADVDVRLSTTLLICLNQNIKTGFNIKVPYI